MKKSVTIKLDSEVLKVLEKRAKKNYFTINEQIEDILRRSAARGISKKYRDKVDDKFLTYFSRYKTGRKKKSKKKGGKKKK